jgi:AraC-like DNA-binding protein
MTDPSRLVHGHDQPVAPLLAAHQRVISTSIDVLHDAVEPLAVGHDLHANSPGEPLDGIVNGLTLETVSLVWVRYGGAGVMVDTPPTEGEFALCAPVAPMGVEYRTHREIAAGSLVLSHDEPMRMTPHPAQGCLVIATTTGRLADHLRDYLGDDAPARPLRFHHIDGPAITAAPIVERTWRHVCAVLDQVADDGIHPMAVRTLEQSLLTAILLGLPNTATAFLAEHTPRPGHHPANRIRDWIEAHHDQPIGVADIAAAAHLSIRRVEAICRDHWGQTPTQLLRGIRLDHARAALLATEPTHGAVARIADGAGFADKRHFATVYRRRFGETPTQTLAGRG